MRYLQCVNKNMAIFHGLLNPKKQTSFSEDGQKKGDTLVKKENSRAKRMLMRVSIFYASKQILLFIGKGSSLSSSSSS